MAPITTLFDVPELLIEQLQVVDEITLSGRITSPTACCPSCGTASRHVQSHYRRTLHDLPSSGRPVSLILDVRRFFCKKSSRDTILRLLRHHSLPDPPRSRIVGLDDWSWKRRFRYGTLICDLERGLPIDLLPDRSVEAVSAWLLARPL